MIECSIFGMLSLSSIRGEQSGVTLKDLSHIGSKERDIYENVEADHEYEILDKYNKDYEDIPSLSTLPPNPASLLRADYELTKCPAYVPVTHGNRVVETTLTQPTSLSSPPQSTAHDQTDTREDTAAVRVYENVSST